MCQLRRITSMASTPPDSGDCGSNSGILRHISPYIAPSLPEQSRRQLGTFQRQKIANKRPVYFCILLLIIRHSSLPLSSRFSIISRFWNRHLDIYILLLVWLKLNDVNFTECYNDMKIGDLSLKINSYRVLHRRHRHILLWYQHQNYISISKLVNVNILVGGSSHRNCC